MKKFCGKPPIVIDTDLLKRFPEQILKEVCLRIDISFDRSMLQWPSGPKSCDGLWARYWYDGVHATTGFLLELPHSPVSDGLNRNSIDADDGLALTPEQLDVYRDSLPFYESLQRQVLGRNPNNPGSSTISVDRLYLPLSGSRSQATTLDHGIAMSTTELSDARNSDILVFIGDRYSSFFMRQL